MIELVQREAGVEGVVEAHVVDALVDRFLDQQRSHCGCLRNAPCEGEGLVGQLVGREDLAHHAQRVSLVGVDRVTREQ